MNKGESGDEERCEEGERNEGKVEEKRDNEIHKEVEERRRPTPWEIEMPAREREKNEKKRKPDSARIMKMEANEGTV